MYTRYAFQGFLMDIYKDRKPLDCSEEFCYYRKPMNFVKNLDLDGDMNITFCFLLSALIFTKTLCYLFLIFRTTLLK